MLHPFDKIAVATAAGTYVIALHYDIDAQAPDYTDDGGLVYLGDARTISAELGDAAHDVARLLRQHSATNGDLDDHQYRSAAAIARYLRLTLGLAGILEVSRSTDRYYTTAPSTDRYEGIDGLAWAPRDATDPHGYSRATVATYSAWANNEVYGYIVTGPDDREIGSCWDFYADPDESITSEAPHGLAHMVSQARDEIDHDVADRTEQANTVGAGITGLI
ncbi:hypothetical protein [Mycolicibacterium neoaurum]|uniref:hypothetical protein n=1 Tax=Mycolicibacterium neoaurum TaxID=1795 RepID=UPI001F4CB223|nr:hypothetical protein [Mycolicibacterium neoaurum]